MTKNQWNALVHFRESFKAQIERWQQELSQSGELEQLIELQKEAAQKGNVPFYEIEHSLVYNISLDELTPKDKIKLIVIGDNPGKDEQRDCNQKYLVGQAGKLAAGFFRTYPEMHIDFRKNAIILNKTPVHSSKTKDLRVIMSNAAASSSNTICRILDESQIWMAQKTAELHASLCENGEPCGLWLVGYTELKERGIFTAYRDTIAARYRDSPLKDNLLVFQHFSMNRFSIDLKEYIKGNTEKSDESGSRTIAEALFALGTQHRKEIVKI